MKNQNKRTEQANPSATVGRCTVCTKPLREGEEHTKVFYGGTYYLVCCASCAAKFEANPTLYLVS